MAENNTSTSTTATAVVNLGATYCDSPHFISPTGELGGWKELREMRSPNPKDPREVLLDLATSYKVAGQLSNWTIVQLLRQIRGLYGEEEVPRLALSKRGGAHLAPLLREAGFTPELIYELRGWDEFGNQNYWLSDSVLERDWGYIREGVIQEIKGGFEWDKIPFETRMGD